LIVFQPIEFEVEISASKIDDLSWAPINDKMYRIEIIKRELGLLYKSGYKTVIIKFSPLQVGSFSIKFFDDGEEKKHKIYELDLEVKKDGSSEIKREKRFPPKKKEIWGYDFDGVLHTLMQAGDDPFKLSGSRHPDHAKLSKAIKNGTFVTLMNQYKNARTFKDIKFALKHKIPIYIVSSNSNMYAKGIQDFLKSNGINLPLDKIIMGKGNKAKTIEDKKITKFIDDSCQHITSLYKEKSKETSYPLQKLVWAYPEEQKYYDVPLQLPLSMCIRGWNSTSNMVYE
jgi:hypothetical protein